MRRIIFNFAVFLFAFGIGLSFAKFGFWQTNETFKKPYKIEGKTLRQVSSFEQIFEPVVKEQVRSKKLIYEKEKAQFLFEPTINKWLKGEHLGEFNEHSENIKNKIIAAHLHIFDERDLLSAAEKPYKTTLIDVNADNGDELFISEGCNSGNYCKFWILEKMNQNDFNVLIYTNAEDFSLRERKSKDYFDIQTLESYDRTQTSMGMKIYKFDGEKYVLSGCYDYIYLHKDKNGTLRKLTKPKLIPIHCC